MTALPKDFAHISRPRSRRRSDRSSARNNMVPLVKPDSYIHSVGTQDYETLTLPNSELPTSLQFLQKFQQATTVLTLGFVAAALGLYAFTVYTPKSWSKEFDKLQTLQKYERQMVASNEAIKHQLAEQAVTPRSGLVKVAPQQNIFLTSTASSLKPIPPKAESAASKLTLQKELVAY
ncbi:MAG: hypothetical protein ACRC6M_16320 [Microcystaceae cyanobacterium]